ncbi:type II secretion system protein J [Fibrobacter sp.]|uniref:PulJ/GspJ family protein n=1 Tax=Fibrobacter sp. TaxID=35828 RepID=UPI00388E1884
MINKWSVDSGWWLGYRHPEPRSLSAADVGEGTRAFSPARQSQAGFTLMELLVYMAIVGIIVLVAGEAFSNSTKFRVRTQNMLKATQEAENVATLFKADVSQMGAKSSMTKSSSGEDTFEEYKSCTAGQTDCIYMDPNNATDNDKDFSSYKIESVEGSTNDKLTIRRIRYGVDGEYQAIEHVEWYETNKILKRSCRVLRKATGYTLPAGEPCSDGATAAEKPIDIAEGVEVFKVYPGIPTIRSNADNAAHREEQIFPPGGSDEFSLIPHDADGNIVEPTTPPTAGGSSVTLSGFAKNRSTDDQSITANGQKKNEFYVATNEDHGTNPSWSSNCNPFSLESGVEYELSFSMVHVSTTDGMQLFVAGRDHMAVGFRNNSDGAEIATLDDFLFYPPTNENSQGARTMRFTAQQNVQNACMVFTFATYSPEVSSGTVTISNLKFRQVAGPNYTFNETLLTKDKKNVKALKLELEISRGGKNNQKGETGKTKIIVPTPSNGVGI